MEIKYYREQQRNYIVVHCELGSKNVNYQRKMLELKNLKSILPVSIKYIDGEIYSYYDISSQVSIKQFYSSKVISSEDLFQMIHSLRDACEEIDRYLLETDRINISPDLIFYDLTLKRYSFFYNVSMEDNTDDDRGIQTFLDFLLEKVSTDDAKALDYVYKIYEYSENGNVELWDICSMSSEEEIKNDITGDEEERSDFSSYSNDYLGPDPYYMGNGEGMDLYENDSLNNEKRNSKKGLAVGISCMGMIGIIACVIIYGLLELNDNELPIMFAGSIFSVGLLTVGIVLFLYDKIQNKRISETNYEETEGYSSSFKKIDCESYSDYKIEPFSHKTRNNSVVTEPICGVPQKHRSRVDDIAVQHTVFFSDEDCDCRYKLFSIDKKNKIHIDIEKFPYTLGKMSDCVDCVIEDESISRLHARIDKCEDGLYIEDLNSTNGVYINGIRMRPNEKKYIEAGDEIRIGRKNYCLRKVV